jgi:cytochrome oxidase Cu insertion factor (SCO1/SenC/PrrC family)
LHPETAGGKTFWFSPRRYQVTVKPNSLEAEMKLAIALASLLAATPLVPALSNNSQQPAEVAKVSLKVGDVAPDFTLLSDQWKTVKLSDFRGKKNVFLAVYVLAFTGG